MNRFIQKLKDGASKASEKAHNIMELNRIQAQIAAKRKEWKHHVYEIGEFVYDAYKKNDLTLAEEGLKKIAKLNLLIEEDIMLLEWKVSELRRQKRCECGEIAPFTANFCAVCGHQLPEPPKFEAEDELGKAFLEAKRAEEQAEAAAAQEATSYSVQPDYAEHDYDLVKEEQVVSQVNLEAAEQGVAAFSDISSYKTGAEEYDDLNVMLAGRRITIMREEDLTHLCCSNCNKAADESAKWCERCGAPFA